MPDIDVGREVAAIELVLRMRRTRACCERARRVRGAAWPWRWPSRRSPAGIGAMVQLARAARVDEALFGEGGGRMLVTVADDDRCRRAGRLAPEGVLVRRVGVVGGDSLTAWVGDDRGDPDAGRGRATPTSAGCRRRWRERPQLDRLDDAPREECGVFGVVAPGREVSRLAFYALHALQHRGQESAGIAVSDSGQVTVQRDLGLVSARLRRALAARPARAAPRSATCATRRPARTSGRTPSRSPTPASAAWWRSGHNGNLTNTGELRAEMELRRRRPAGEHRLGDHRRDDRRRGGQPPDGRAAR